MYRVEQQDVDGKWWPGCFNYDTRGQAQYEVNWLDCPGRVVGVSDE